MTITHERQRRLQAAARPGPDYTTLTPTMVRDAFHDEPGPYVLHLRTTGQVEHAAALYAEAVGCTPGEALRQFAEFMPPVVASVQVGTCARIAGVYYDICLLDTVFEAMADDVLRGARVTPALARFGRFGILEALVSAGRDEYAALCIEMELRSILRMARAEEGE